MKRATAFTVLLYKNAFVIWQEHLELYKQRGLEDFENAVLFLVFDKKEEIFSVVRYF